MKKIILLIFLIASSFQTINSQEKNEKDLISTGKWHIGNMEKDGQKINLSVEYKKMCWMIFHKDGKLEGMELGQTYNGIWEFDGKNRILKTTDFDGKVERKLISVTQNKLIFSVKDQGSELITEMEKQ